MSQAEHQATQHNVPHSDTAPEENIILTKHLREQGEVFSDPILLPGPRGRYPGLGGEADTVYGQLLLVNVVIILKDVTQIPDLN